MVSSNLSLFADLFKGRKSSRSISKIPSFSFSNFSLLYKTMWLLGAVKQTSVPNSCCLRHFLNVFSGIEYIAAISFSAQAIKVGALYLDTAGFFGEIKYGIESAGESEGIELTGANSQSDVAREAEFIDTLLATGVDVVIMSPVSTESSVAAVERLAEAGIPVAVSYTHLTLPTKRIV